MDNNLQHYATPYYDPQKLMNILHANQGIERTLLSYQAFG